MSRYLFVGERQSPKAARYGHTWSSGNAAAKTLHDALSALGLNPQAQEYTNLWSTPGLGPCREEPEPATLARLDRAAQERTPVVALGALVSRELSRLGITHLRLVHPAARGRIRKRERYVQHVRETLLSGV